MQTMARPPPRAPTPRAAAALLLILPLSFLLRSFAFSAAAFSAPPSSRRRCRPSAPTNPPSTPPASAASASASALGRRNAPAVAIPPRRDPSREGKERATTALSFAPFDHRHLASPLLAEAETAAAESWRQYVPLVVSSLVILDILLGSPAANLALAPMRRATEAQDRDVDLLGGDDDDGGGGGRSGGGVGGLLSLGASLDPSLGNDGVPKNPKERVDTATIAGDALERARGVVELREYLEANKSDEQRYEEMRKKLDRQMEDFDSKG